MPWIRPDDDARCRELAELVGLGSRLDHRPCSYPVVSSSAWQLLAAWSMTRFYILADEATGNLDSQTSRRFGDCLPA